MLNFSHYFIRFRWSCPRTWARYRYIVDTRKPYSMVYVHIITLLINTIASGFFCLFSIYIAFGIKLCRAPGRLDQQKNPSPPFFPCPVIFGLPIANENSIVCHHSFPSLASYPPSFDHFTKSMSRLGCWWLVSYLTRTHPMPHALVFWCRIIRT